MTVDANHQQLLQTCFKVLSLSVASGRLSDEQIASHAVLIDTLKVILKNNPQPRSHPTQSSSIKPRVQVLMVIELVAALMVIFLPNPYGLTKEVFYAVCLLTLGMLIAEFLFQSTGKGN